MHVSRGPAVSCRGPSSGSTFSEVAATPTTAAAVCRSGCALEKQSPRQVRAEVGRVAGDNRVLKIRGAQVAEPPPLTRLVVGHGGIGKRGSAMDIVGDAATAAIRYKRVELPEKVLLMISAYPSLNRPPP